MCLCLDTIFFGFVSDHCLSLSVCSHCCVASRCVTLSWGISPISCQQSCATLTIYMCLMRGAKLSLGCVLRDGALGRCSALLLRQIIFQSGCTWLCPIGKQYKLLTTHVLYTWAVLDFSLSFFKSRESIRFSVALSRPFKKASSHRHSNRMCSQWWLPMWMRIATSR